MYRLALLLLILILLTSCSISVYETNDVANYGMYIGNYNNIIPTNFISSFFPDSISSTWREVDYHYKAIKFDTYAYEAFLRFSIRDKIEFHTFLATIVSNPDDCKLFEYDSKYKIYPVSNVFSLVNSSKPHKDGSYAISHAEIGMVLFSEAKNEIIFFAMGVHDGGGATTNDLNLFWNLFDISPAEYETHAYASPYYQEFTNVN